MIWVSQRHGFRIKSIPTRKTQGGSSTLYTPDMYAAILDSVFEMADDIKTGNGVPADVAIDMVLIDENWKLRKHERDQIVAKLEGREETRYRVAGKFYKSYVGATRKANKLFEETGTIVGIEEVKIYG